MNLQLMTPEFVMLGTAFLLLILELFMSKGSRKVTGVIGIIGTCIAGYTLSCAETGRAVSGLFIQDTVSIFFKWLFLIVAFIIMYIVMMYEDKIRNWRGEFYSLVIFSITGMMFLSSITDFVGFYVSLEFVAVCLYVLAAFTNDNPLTVEAGLKYLVTGALASGFLVYGISFIYGASGATGFVEVAQSLKTADGNGFLIIGITLLVIGLTFKISSIPFHVWAPDVYQGAPTPVTALLAAASKSAGFIVIMRILFTGLIHIKAEWVMLVSILSAASLLFGNLAAMPQKDIKRLIAYAGIGSAGYLLMAVAAASALGAGAIMFYLMTYVFAILGSFIAIVAFNNSEGSDLVDSYAGLSRRSPLLAATLFIGLLSIAGIPPLGGFIAKFYIIAAAVKEGLWVLAVIGVVMAIVAMYYFLLVVKSMYLRPPRNTEPIKVDLTTRALLYLINAITIFLGIYPGPLTDWVMDIAKVLF
ncbi:MAG TPA: NADH-quinone oxidoreductase subunit N [Thermodesulfobacteriota bacterium]|nr:NADH-quinone oxidoreductase subunit N [Thermodesulfobacteriota bacterium]